MLRSWIAFFFLSTLAFSADQKSRIKIVFLGDSLTEGYGVPQDQAYPSLIQKALNARGRDVEVVNASISGSTSASAPSRMNWILKGHPHWVVLALGANDGLRGLPVQEMKTNLHEAIRSAQSSKVKILLVGMKVPPNYGKAYSTRFEKVFKDLSEQDHVPLIPFLLEGVGGEPNLNQEDKLHPNAKGHERVAKNVLRVLEKLL